MKFITLLIGFFFAVNSFAQAPTAGLVSYFKLDGNYTNEINTGLNGSNFGSTSTTNNSGSLVTAMNFANPTATVAQYATHPLNSTVNFSGSNNFSVSFFAYINSPYIHTGGFYDNGINYGGYGIWYSTVSGVLTIQFIYRGVYFGTTSGSVPLGTWFHVCCTRDGGTLRIYINGTLNASNTEGLSTPNYTYPARIGSMFFQSLSNYNPHHGKMDELRIYNRALSLAEISTIQVLLPVKLINFSSQLLDNNAVSLKWSTAQEHNSKHYEIERSTNGEDFEKVGTINTNGNTSTQQDYGFSDILSSFLLSNSKIYYRLKMVDQDNSFTYSKIVSVNLNGKKPKVTILPNPVVSEGFINLSGMQKGKAVISVINSAGVTVLNFNKTITAETMQLPLDVSTLADGVYIISVNNNGILTKQKFVKAA